MTAETRTVTREYALEPMNDRRNESLKRARVALERLPSNFRDGAFCKLRAEWAERIACAFPDMSRDEIREALVEKFGVSINGTKITAALKRAKASERARAKYWRP